MEHLIVLYQEELKTHPAITQVLTIAALLAAGDVISQTFFQKKPFFDARQSVNFFIVGLLYTGSISVAWFGIVERLIVIDGFAAAVIKVLVSQVFFSPLFTLGLLVVYGLLKGQSWKDIGENIRTKYVALLCSRFIVYPLAQFINFEFVPIVYRPMYGSVISLFWNMYLSWKANQVKVSADPVDPEEKDSSDSE
ncbi:unnamed protein product [Ixodes persulcatus]